MKKMLIPAAVLANLSTPANACDPAAFCNGVISISGGWVIVDKFPHCRLKIGSDGAKRLLKTCPAGTRCHAEIVVGEEYGRNDDDNDLCYATRNVKKFPGPSFERKD
jgi:hypothetical protein